MNGVEFDGRPVELSSSDKLLCIEQMISVVSSVSLNIIDFFWEPDSIPGCTAHDESRCTNRRLLSRKAAEEWRTDEVFFLRLPMPDDWPRLADACAPCMPAMRTPRQEALNTFWNGLPQRFSLPGWSELRKIKKNALE
jgi:hypothetical protein